MQLYDHANSEIKQAFQRKFIYTTICLTYMRQEFNSEGCLVDFIFIFRKDLFLCS